MGDQNQSALIALEPLLQPNDRIEIEVVGRFIEQQQIGAADQRLRRLRRIRQPPEKSLTGRSSCSLLNPRPWSRLEARGANGPRVDGVQLAVDGGDGVAIVALVGGVQFRFQLTVFTIAINNIVERRLTQGGRLTGLPGELPVSRISKVTAIRANLVFQQRQQGGFTAAVLPTRPTF